MAASKEYALQHGLIIDAPFLRRHMRLVEKGSRNVNLNQLGYV